MERDVAEGYISFFISVYRPDIALHKSNVMAINL